MSYQYSVDGPHVVLRFEYHPSLVVALKTRIPKSYRRWNPERQAWIIGREYWPTAQRVLADFGFVGVAPPRPVSDSWRRLHLQPDAPPEVVDAAYKALARVHHPDHGGDNGHMREINLAYDALKAAQK
jgi:hypothetical protein